MLYVYFLFTDVDLCGGVVWCSSRVIQWHHSMGFEMATPLNILLDSLWYMLMFFAIDHEYMVNIWGRGWVPLRLNHYYSDMLVVFSLKMEVRCIAMPVYRFNFTWSLKTRHVNRDDHVRAVRVGVHFAFNNTISYV